MSEYKMSWGDIIRMAGDFAFPPNTFDIIELTPTKSDYEEKINNQETLRRAVIRSFNAARKKFVVRKWILDIIEVPSHFFNFEVETSRWNIEFIKVREEEEKTEQEEIEEDKE